jgi:hypothetical protein
MDISAAPSLKLIIIKPEISIRYDGQAQVWSLPKAVAAVQTLANGDSTAAESMFSA